MKKTIWIMYAVVTTSLLGSIVPPLSNAQEQPSTEEARLEQALSEGDTPARREAIELLKAKGRQEPYKGMLKKWLRAYDRKSMDNQVISIVIHLADEDLFAAALERLEELEAKWSALNIELGHLLAKLFGSVSYEPILPFIEKILARPEPEFDIKSDVNDHFREWWVKRRACVALGRQKGEAAAETVRTMRDKFVSWVEKLRKEGKMFFVSLEVDIQMHQHVEEFDQIIADIAWEQERPRYISWIQDHDAYRRWRAIMMFQYKKDCTAVPYLISAIDDTRLAWIPCSERTLNFLRKTWGINVSDEREMADKVGYLVLGRISSAAMIALEVITRSRPYLAADGTFVYVSREEADDSLKYLDDEAVLRQAWKDWWKENLDKPEYQAE